MSKAGHISKLHLFARDTDAPDVIKGFKYQELKTLEVWLYNKVHGIDEHIYCDFEEDIFQRDLKTFKSTFKQLKLYSSKNFSFSSEEITKSLAHFFMLFVKGEYLLDDPLFIFETNTSVASKKGDNDADLLADWVSNQNNLSEDLIAKCSAKLKSIIDVYINEQYEKLEKQGKIDDLPIAKEVYDNLSNETWELFTKAIRWVFDGISRDGAIEVSVGNSLELIGQLPFPIGKDEHSLVFDRLRGVVGDKSMQSDPHSRLLTNDLLESQLLSLGSKDDKVFLESYELWKDVKGIPHFIIGEFYQVLFAAKHCRRNEYLKDHSSFWISLLQKYISIPDILSKFRREAIYEILWLTLYPSLDLFSGNSIEELKEMVFEYFTDFEEYDDAGSIEDTHILLTIIFTSQRLNLIKIDNDQIKKWIDRFDDFLEECEIKASDKNVYCRLLEIKAFGFINKKTWGFGDNNLNKAQSLLEKIIQELPNAPFYPVSQLGAKLDGVFDIAIDLGLDKDFGLLEEFSEKLLPIIQQREGDFSAAKSYKERGMKHLDSTNPKGILKALNYFHKAKDLYQNEDAYEGFVLAILVISQLYASIGMNLAAKYYSLSAIWFCFDTEDPQLYKRISEAYAILLHTDLKQGSWMSALLDFENYFTARAEFDINEFDPEIDEVLAKTLAHSAFIIALAPLISNQLASFIEYEKSKIGSFYSKFLKESVEFIIGEQSKIGTEDLVARKLDNPPINDIGDKRVISWKAFGSIWNVEFQNDFIHNSIGEEFASLIQIIQSDIAFSELDFRFIKGTIQIIIEIVDLQKWPEQLPSNSSSKWKVYLPVIQSKKPEDKNMHYAKITTSFQIILNELSLLPKARFKELFISLFERGLSNKTLIVNLYQKAYRDLYSVEKFENSMRSKFKSELLNIRQYESSLFRSIDRESDLNKKIEVSLNNSNQISFTLAGNPKVGPSVVFLGFDEPSKGIIGYNSLIELSTKNSISMVITEDRIKSRINISLKDGKSIVEINSLIYDMDNYLDFINKQPFNRPFVILIGHNPACKNQIVATNDPFSPLMINSYIVSN